MAEFGLVFRVIPYYISNFEKLHLPVTMQQFADYNNGIVLVTGPTGSGKSSILDGITLALYGEVARKSSNFINIAEN